MTTSFQIDNVRIGSGSLFLIAGPCVIESEKHALFMAEVIKGVTRSLNFPFIFKASYDKANRTSIRSFRGPGLLEGLRILKKVKDEVHVPILTDVHETADVAKVAEVADILQIPKETVTTRLLRSRRRLQCELDPELRDALRSTFPFAGRDCDELTERVLAKFLAAPCHRPA